MRTTRKIGFVFAMMAILVLTTPLGAAAHHSPGHGKGKGGGGDGGGGDEPVTYTVTGQIGGVACAGDDTQGWPNHVLFDDECVLEDDGLEKIGVTIESKRGTASRIYVGFTVSDTQSGEGSPSGTWVRTEWISITQVNWPPVTSSGCVTLTVLDNGPFAVSKNGRDHNTVARVTVGDVDVAWGEGC